jgi:hypothetical protein
VHVIRHVMTVDHHLPSRAVIARDSEAAHAGILIQPVPEDVKSPDARQCVRECPLSASADVLSRDHSDIGRVSRVVSTCIDTVSTMGISANRSASSGSAPGAGSFCANAARQLASKNATE